MVIGNRAASKALRFIIQVYVFLLKRHVEKWCPAGLSGTRNCDWFFSTDGVLLDTAGRY